MSIGFAIGDIGCIKPGGERMDRDGAQRFAAEWIEAWNSHDLELIFSHYADDFEMSSPLIVERMNEPTGTLSGKDAIRLYWEKRLAQALRFELLDVLVGVNSITLSYRNQNGRRAAEVLVFNERGEVVKGMAHCSE